MTTQSEDPRPVATDGAPRAIGPYRQAISFDRLLFCSGQVPLDPTSGTLVDGDIAEMTLRCLTSLQAVCEAADTSLERALRLTIYVVDLGDFAAVNGAYESFFDGHLPARTTVQVAALPAGAPIEIDAIVAR